MITYEESIDFLYNSLPVFQRVGADAYKPGLGTSIKLAEIFGNPERRYPCIHIAGTNGKGSTAHSLAAILQSEGYKVGLYTSPHIFDFRERIRVNGDKISAAAVVDFVSRWLEIRKESKGLSPSFFELTSTMAFEYFSKQDVDIAVIETGLGGRLDSTNIIIPILSVITNISLDHTALLGDTLSMIASEKAGIIKHGVPVVVGEHDPETDGVFIAKAESENSQLIFADHISADINENCNIYPETPFGEVKGELQGEYQVKNAATIFTAIMLLRSMEWKISNEAVRKGMADVTGLTHLFGRWSRIGESPLIIADTGHNCGGWKYLVDMIARMPQKKKALVIGFVADKDLTVILDYISSLGRDLRVIFSTPFVPRGLKAELLAVHAASKGIIGTVIDDVNSALAEAKRFVGEDGFILVAGSNFLIADLKN